MKRAAGKQMARQRPRAAKLRQMKIRTGRPARHRFISSRGLWVKPVFRQKQESRRLFRLWEEMEIHRLQLGCFRKEQTQ